jgi:uncharacterized protein (AIM24 family)
MRWTSQGNHKFREGKGKFFLSLHVAPNELRVAAEK